MPRIPSEYAPTKMDEDLERLCASIAPGITPVLVPIQPWKESLPGECFANIERYVQEHGGRRLLGWRLMRWANIMVECEAHAVWEGPTGALLDITPYTQVESLFLHDPNLRFTGHRILNRRLILTDSPLIAEMMRVQSKIDSFVDGSPADVPVSAPEPLVAQLFRIQARLKEDVSRNDPCPCQSGLKFKKCCGRFPI